MKWHRKVGDKSQIMKHYMNHHKTKEHIIMRFGMEILATLHPPMINPFPLGKMVTNEEKW